MPSPENPQRALATVLAYQFMNREHPVDDLSILSSEFLAQQEELLAAREALKGWAAERGLEAKSEGTIADVLDELTQQVPAKANLAVVDAEAVLGN